MLAKHLIFATTGTSHFKFDRMLKIVNECVNCLEPDTYELTVQFGSSNIKVMEGCGGETFDFLSRERSELLFQQAKFVFSHCGIGSIFNALKYNTPTIVIPRLLENNEFSDDHQLQIADEIKVNPLILLLDDQSDNYLAQFSAFIDKHTSNKKIEVDLINYQLAEKMKNFLYKV